MDLKCCHNCKKDAIVCDVYHKCGKDCKEWEAPIQTNADRIRAMSDEELAEFLESAHTSMAIKLGGEYIVRAKEYISIWLKQPAEEERL